MFVFRGALEPEQIEDVKAALRERKRAGRDRRPSALHWGGAHVENPVISSAYLQFLENRKFNRQEICAIFKVPQELLGFVGVKGMIRMWEEVLIEMMQTNRSNAADLER